MTRRKNDRVKRGEEPFLPILKRREEEQEAPDDFCRALTQTTPPGGILSSGCGLPEKNCFIASNPFPGNKKQVRTAPQVPFVLFFPAAQQHEQRAYGARKIIRCSKTYDLFFVAVTV